VVAGNTIFAAQNFGEAQGIYTFSCTASNDGFGKELAYGVPGEYNSHIMCLVNVIHYE
jgi:hypothetical protein